MEIIRNGEKRHGRASRNWKREEEKERRARDMEGKATNKSEEKTHAINIIFKCKYMY